MEDGEKGSELFQMTINYSDPTRRHGLGDKKLGNMIVKEFLIEQAVNLQCYQQFHKRPARPRQRLNKMLGGEIPVPTPKTNREIKETLTVNFEAEGYTIGELVVPKQHKKLILNSDGTLNEVLSTVSGRKIPLAENIKRDLERSEMKDRGYGVIDVPALVEKPHIYILGRCIGKDVKQLGYSQTRCQCLDELQNNLLTSKGCPVTDIMRFFHTNGPGQQFESDRIKIVRAGPAGEGKEIEESSPSKHDCGRAES
ncbi:unnamed protein product [Porites evermanni]|uniref:Uncharacterized protein n=1 Tax=Porites evermanni TaxID=104178 RepID=A0ABN8LPB6_9CNID|nr:unnamed protein product [Porites evermanni]